MKKWCYYSGIWKGVSHQKCQDAVNIIDTNRLLIAVLADGLGSLENSEVASQALAKKLPSFFDTVSIGFELNEKQLLVNIINESQNILSQEAKKKKCSLESMDSTLLFVCIDKKRQIAVIGQIGDGAICLFHKDEAELFYRPEKPIANGTSTVLHYVEKDCCLRIIDLKKHNIIGFILSSDGLEDEIYSSIGCVIKDAEIYFNALTGVSEDVDQIIEERIDKITSGDTLFDDDISLGIISCAEIEISLPNDVTWLCKCGHRNDFRSTRCESCNYDIVKLHPEELYRKYGGKFSTLKWLYEHPQEEYSIIKPIDKISSDSSTDRGRMESDIDRMEANPNDANRQQFQNKHAEKISQQSSSRFRPLLSQNKPIVSSWSFTIKQVLIMMGITFLFSSILVSALWYTFIIKKQDDTTNESSEFNISSRQIYEDIYSFPIYENEGFDGAYSGQTTYYKNKYMLPNGFGAYYLNGKIVVGKSNLGKKDGTFVSIDEDCSISFLTYHNGILVNRSGSFSYSNEDNETTSNTESNVESTAEQSTDYWYEWNTP